jgi:hypothetical protein
LQVWLSELLNHELLFGLGRPVAPVQIFAGEIVAAEPAAKSIAGLFQIAIFGMREMRGNLLSGLTGLIV